LERVPRKRNFAPIPEETERPGKIVLDAAYRVHTALGPGLLESVYETTLAHEIRKAGIAVATQVGVPVRYDGLEHDVGFRLDLLIEKAVIAELKAVENIIPLYEAQLMTYLRLSGVRLGYLISFNVPHLKDGIKRIVV
jgi:GxxExxY protein